MSTKINAAGIIVSGDLNPNWKGGKIEAHHIDHNKLNNSVNNLITLCSVCNSKANFNRKFWSKLYRLVLKKLYGY